MVDFAALLSARVPRYTSYPTAVQFHPGVTTTLHEQWIGELPDGMPISLYLHIPFCKQLCWFCGCHTHVANTYSPVKAYLGLLKAELAKTARTLNGAHPVTHIHWGGGSPTILASGDFCELVGFIRDHFTLATNAEHAVEIDPRTLTQDLAHAFRTTGVNRASIGVQDCDPVVLRAVNRLQSIETTRHAVALLRGAGVSRLNIDLMYGLPHQTSDGIKRTIDEVHELAPDRLAVFGYAHLPSFKSQQALIEESALPDLVERLAQYETGRRHLQEKGYLPIGLDHFARSTDPLSIAHQTRSMGRNFQGYTTDDAPALIGIGSSAISAFPNGYTQNAVQMPAYRKSILADEFATVRGVSLTEDDKLRRAVISELMCFGNVDLARTCQSFGKQTSVFTHEIQALTALQADGLVDIQGSSISIAERACAAIRVVCAVFDAYTSTSMTRHATAV